ncbi:MAG TPA: rod shape-determining protein MreD [Syntrophales bacterium]|nr:rod shape-determining protein MreD [Syntrophales bacterium]
MIRLLSLLVIAVALIVLQTTLLEIVLLHQFSVELSLLLVLYAGFRYEPGEGAAISILCGFLTDCVTGSPTGFFVFLYVLVFSATKLISERMYADSRLFFAFFAFVAALAEGVLAVLLYRIIAEADVFHYLLRHALPQALVLALLSPLFFRGFDLLGDRLDGKASKQTG